MTVIMSNIDVVDCAKCLVDASVTPGLNIFIMMGIMPNIFISKPNQISNQWR